MEGRRGRGGKERCKPVESGKGLREGEGARKERGRQGGRERERERRESSGKRAQPSPTTTTTHKRKQEEGRGLTTDKHVGWLGREEDAAPATATAAAVAGRPYTAIQLTSVRPWRRRRCRSEKRWAAIPAKQSDSRSPLSAPPRRTTTLSFCFVCSLALSSGGGSGTGPL